MVSVFSFVPSCPRFDSQHHQIFSEEKIVNVAEVNQRLCLEESGLWLDNVDLTHLVLARWVSDHLKVTQRPVASNLGKVIDQRDANSSKEDEKM